MSDVGPFLELPPFYTLHTFQSIHNGSQTHDRRLRPPVTTSALPISAHSY